MTAFDKLYLLSYLVLMAAYTAVRGVQWHDLLAALEIDAPLRSQVFAFLVGEVTKSIPIGNYVQNYTRAGGARDGAPGHGGGASVPRRRHRPGPPAPPGGRPAAGGRLRYPRGRGALSDRAGPGYPRRLTLAGAGRVLFQPGLLLDRTPPIVPLPLDIGVVEISAVGAFLAVGVSKTDAVGVVLINRALSIGVSLVIALIGAALLRDEGRAALRGRGHVPHAAADATDASGAATPRG